MGIASLVMAALVFFVLPQFGTVFENMGKEPPPFTKFLLETSAVARAYWPWLLGGAVMSGIFTWQASRSPHSREVIDNFVLNFSLLRNASRALLAGRTFRLLGMMLESGVTLLDAVRLCQDAVSNSLYRKLFLKLEQQVLAGSGIASTISATEYLPMGVAQMVRTAERTGRLGSVLEMIGHYYEEEGERKLKQFVKLLEPVIIMAMGVVVAGIVSSIMLPLLDVSTLSH
jgi:type II secretory pathway component PulF